LISLTHPTVIRIPPVVQNPLRDNLLRPSGRAPGRPAGRPRPAHAPLHATGINFCAAPRFSFEESGWKTPRAL